VKVRSPVAFALRGSVLLTAPRARAARGAEDLSLLPTSCQRPCDAKRGLGSHPRLPMNRQWMEG
jgi:hypothetical protein